MLYRSIEAAGWMGADNERTDLHNSRGCNPIHRRARSRYRVGGHWAQRRSAPKVERPALQAVGEEHDDHRRQREGPVVSQHVAESAEHRDQPRRQCAPQGAGDDGGDDQPEDQKVCWHQPRDEPQQGTDERQVGREHYLELADVLRQALDGRVSVPHRLQKRRVLGPEGEDVVPKRLHLRVPYDRNTTN
eukprot:TRINITY_DN17164_c0_g1_i1.p2 TRINITY_DN17164_c0_g1~~TRINITY_DN17164_c0_g1_i1.p2  ORF type:complete len:189 (-),score=3.44 TRINITY_DN17164_c0_g1_i1:19-585(-)